MKILIVDDEDGIRRLCERTLSQAGHRCAAAASGAQAAALLSEGWDMVLSDIAMPGAVDGLDLLSLARARTTADVVLMTGNPDLESAVKAVHEGAYDYLIKPFSGESLRAAARRCEEKRRLSRELNREKTLRGQLDAAYAELRGLKKIREKFGQFVTPEVVQYLLRNPDEAFKLGQSRRVSVLFADVRGFTPFASRVRPQEAVQLLNELLSPVVDAVHQEGGIVNKFLGDGLMAVFGAPIPDEDHPAAAVRAASRARDAVAAICAKRRAAALDALQMGFGVNTGEAVCGCIGGAQRAEYTVIGHAVNVAQRLQAAAGPGEILIGAGTRERLEGRFRLSERAVKASGIDAALEAAELAA